MVQAGRVSVQPRRHAPLLKENFWYVLLGRDAGAEVDCAVAPGRRRVDGAGRCHKRSADPILNRDLAHLLRGWAGVPKELSGRAGGCSGLRIERNRVEGKAARS